MEWLLDGNRFFISTLIWVIFMWRRSSDGRMDGRTDTIRGNCETNIVYKAYNDKDKNFILNQSN